MSPLQIGRKYCWCLFIICKPEDASANIIVDGNIQIAPLLIDWLSQAAIARVALYAVDSIWDNAIALIIYSKAIKPPR